MDKPEQVYIIPDDCCAKVGIHGCFFSMNHIGVHAFKPLNALDKRSAYSGSLRKCCVYDIRQSVLLFHKIMRKLVNESTSTFLGLQEASLGPDKSAQILRFSYQYRSVIRASLENLQDELALSPSERMELESYVTILYSVEFVWHLCEILFLDSRTQGSNILILNQLMDWIKFHFPKTEKNATALLQDNVIGLESHPDYWETVIGCVLQGNITMARLLLKKHSDADSQPFSIADQTLKSMPSYNNVLIGGSSSTADFKMQQKLWIADIQTKIDAKQFQPCYNLNLIMKLMCGNEVAWGEIQQYTETWYELLGAWLYYNNPTIKCFELGHQAKQCMEKMSIRNQITQLDKILLAALELDVIKVIDEMQQIGDNGWSVTHLTDLLYHAGTLDLVSETYELRDFCPKKLRNAFLMDYGTLIVSHKSLWQTGLDYLDHCQENSKEIVGLMLSRLPLGNEKRVNKILNEAERRQFNGVAQSICKTCTLYYKNKKRMGSALTWAIKSQHNSLISQIANQILNEYITTGEMKQMDLLESLGPAILTNNRLLFLGKYCELKRLIEHKQAKKAAKLMISLLESKTIPEFFWEEILNEAVALLKSTDTLFTSDELFVIMHCLEQKWPRTEEQRHLNEISSVRQMTCKNLAKALLLESQ